MFVKLTIHPLPSVAIKYVSITFKKMVSKTSYLLWLMYAAAFEIHSKVLDC